MACSRRRSSALLRFDALQEHAHDFAVQRRLQHGVFVTRVDARVVVDLDDVRLMVDLFQIDAIQSVADQIGDFQRDLDDFFRRFADRERVAIAFDRRFTRFAAAE